MNTKLVVALLGIGMLSGLLLVAPPAAGVTTVSVDPPKYSGNPSDYVPGEQLKFRINTQPGDPLIYDVLIVWDDGTPANRRNWSGSQFNDIQIPTGSTSVNRTFQIPDVNAATPMPDGDFYVLEVHDSLWIETNGTGTTFATYPFRIRTWTLNLDLDKNRYLPGDYVTVLWSVNMIRDRSLAPSGSGQLWAWDTAGNRLITPFPYTFTASTGTFRFQLNTLIPTTQRVWVYSYFNSTVSNPDRFSYDAVNAPIDDLQMIVNVLALQYEPGGIVTVDIMAKNTDSIFPNPGDPGAAGVNVTVTVTDQITGLPVDRYGAVGLVTDMRGNLRHVFQLDSTITDGTPFQVSAEGTFRNGPNDIAADTFTVTSRAAMTLILTFDKSQYLSGDTVTMTADVIGNPGPFTYNYETRDAATGNLYERTTSSSNTHQYAIPTTYDGSLVFGATVDDGNGNRRTGSQTFAIVFGILTVTLDRLEYNAGDTITATYALTRNPAVLTAPTYYFEIFDAGVLVKSGIATGPVAYQVPQVPAASYQFQITAAESGRSISGSATASLVSGVLLSIGFDKASYLPGETMRIDYTLAARGRSRLPTGLSFTIAMPGVPSRTVQATSTSGTQTSGSLYYTVPGGYNEGPVPILVLETRTSAIAQETVIIGPTNSFWTTQFGGIPAFDVILGLLVLFAFILIVLMWYRLKPGMAGVKAPAEKPSAPPPPATAGPGPAPMTVSCKACGAPIEITTSKRPIEVMCPSCGETQMVQ